LRLRLADESDAQDWDNFIIENNRSAFFSLYNLFEWRRILQNAYGYNSYYLIAENKNGIIGCFPLIYVKSSLLHNRLISLPFTDHGCGPSVERQNIKVLTFLLDNARRLAISLKARSIQINSPQDYTLGSLSYVGYKRFYDYFTFILDLNQPAVRLWANFKKQVRNSIKKAEKSGVEVTLGYTKESMKRVHAIHVNNMKRLGTPPHSKSFFLEMWNQMQPKGHIRTYLARYKGQDIAAVVIFPHRESVRWGMGVMLSEYRWLNPMYLLLWEAINWSKQKGYQVFDMGGSRADSGNFDFKEGWIGKNQSNGKIIKLNHLHLLLGTDETNIVSVGNPRYMYLSNLWRKCVPFFIANSIGPYLRKQIAM